MLSILFSIWQEKFKNLKDIPTYHTLEQMISVGL